MEEDRRSILNCGRNTGALGEPWERQETHTMRQATQHGWLASLLGDGDKGTEIVYGEEKNIFLGRLDQPKQNKYLVPARQAQRTNQERTLSFVLFESPRTAVSTHLSFNSQQGPPLSSLSGRGSRPKRATKRKREF
jgi:hypothetical protein